MPLCSGVPASRRRLVTSLALALLGVAAMLVFAVLRGPERLVAGDGHYVLAAARSLAYDGDLDLGNQYWVMGDRWGLGRDPTADHWQLPSREIGASLVMVPGVWLHWLLGLGLASEPVFACLLAAASLGPTWLGCVRVLDQVRGPLGLDERASEGLAAAAVLGFVVPYYAVGAGGYAHALDATLGAWLLATLLARRSPGLVGLLLAAAILTRLQNALWLLWPAVEAGRALATRSEDRWADLRRLAIVAAIAALGVAPQVWLGWAHPGSERGAWGWTLGFFDLADYPRDLLRVGFGAHGLVRWTPIAGLAAAGLGLAARDRRPWAWPALAVGLGLALLFASVRDVDAGDAFGARRWAGAVGGIALGLAPVWAHVQGSPGRRRAVVGLLAALVAANLVVTGLALAGRVSLAAPHTGRGYR